jgi:hypothetical protein
MELLVEKGAYIKKTDRLLELGIPEHLRRKNTENEMRAVNKVSRPVCFCRCHACPGISLFLSALSVVYCVRFCSNM